MTKEVPTGKTYGPQTLYNRIKNKKNQYILVHRCRALSPINVIRRWGDADEYSGLKNGGPPLNQHRKDVCTTAAPLCLWCRIDARCCVI